jgi:predicted TPR repeat methyltransferase
MGKGNRPEHSAPPELFYDDKEAFKYTKSSRVMEIQEKLTHRALELLLLKDDGCPKLILDIGCGSGLSGQVLTDQGTHLATFYSPETHFLYCAARCPACSLFHEDLFLSGGQNLAKQRSKTT